MKSRFACTLMLAGSGWLFCAGNGAVGRVPALDWVRNDYTGVLRSGTNMVLATHHPTGNVQFDWLAPDGTTTPYFEFTASWMGAMAFDAQGDLLVCGPGTTPLSTATPQPGDSYLAKVGPNGQPMWVHTYSGNGLMIDRRLAVDAQGYCYLVVGITAESPGPTALEINGIPLAGANYNGLVVKVTPNGVEQIKAETSSFSPDGSAIRTTDIAPDDFGNCFVVGSLSGGSQFDNVSVSLLDAAGNPMTSGMVLSRDASLRARWVRAPNQVPNIVLTNGLFLVAATDATGNCFAGGWYFDARDADTPTDGGHAWVAKYSATGDLVWLHTGRGTNRDSVTALVSDSVGGCWVTGWFQGQATFSGTNITSLGLQDLFLAHYDTGGALVSLNQLGAAQQAYFGGSHENGPGICVDLAGHVYVAGSAVQNPDMSDTGVVNNWTTGVPFVARWTSGAASLPAVSIEAPRLAATFQGGKLVLNWPLTTNQFVLESTTALGGTTGWQAMSVTPAANAQLMTVEVPRTGDQRFYRLRKQ